MESKSQQHKVEHVDMPIQAPVVTYNFGDITRYFKYNMGAGMIMATLERMVQDDRMDRMGNNIGTMMKFIGVGIMVFLVILGAYILLNSPVVKGTGAQQPSGAPPGALLAVLLFVPWRKHEHLPDVQ